MELRVAAQKRFGDFLLDVDFAVRGDRVGVFGPSGCGKSTLVGLVAGLYRSDRGLIILDGETSSIARRGATSRAEQRRIGMVFQRPSLFPHLSVKGNLIYGYRACPPDLRKISSTTW